MSSLNRILSQPESCGDMKQIESPSLLENLQRRKVQLEQKLNDINAAIVALEKNPEFTELLLLINKAHY